MKKILMIIGFVLLLVGNAFGATYYINGSGSSYVGTQGTYGIGNDTTGDGSITTPWATLTKAETESGATGDTIYVAENIYNDTWEPAKGTAWITDGTVVVRRASGSNAVLVYGSSTKSFNGFTIDGNSSRTSAVSLGTSTRSTTFTNCTVTGGTTYQINSLINTDSPGVIFTGCTMLIAAGQGGYSNLAGITFTNGVVTVSDSGTRIWYCDSSNTGGLIFTGNTVNISAAVFQALLFKNDGDITITDNTFNITVSIDSFLVAVTAGKISTFIFSNNIINSDSITNNQQFLNVSLATYDVTISNNTFDFDYTSASDKILINLSDQVDSMISGNTLTSTCVGGMIFANILSTGTDCGVLTISGNTIETASPNSYVFYIGSEITTSGDYKINGSLIYDNEINLLASSGNIHAVLVGFNRNASAYRNQIVSNGAGVGIVFKGDGSAGSTYTAGGAWSNAISGLATQPSLLAKGMNAVPFSNNTCQVPSSVDMGANGVIRFRENGVGENSINGVMKNNIVNAHADNLVIVEPNCQTGFTSTNNDIYQSGTGNIGIVNSVEYADITAWNVVYSDDIGADPKLLSSGKISKLSPAVDAGTWITGVNEEGQADLWGKYIHRLPNIGADQGAGAPKRGRRILRIGGGGGIF